MPPAPATSATRLDACLTNMGASYRADPQKAVRSQAFIKYLHAYLKTEFEGHLSPWAKKRDIGMLLEPKLLDGHRGKDLDLCVCDPVNGPLLLVGVRSQMSSIGNNTLGYIDGIIGEAESLQKRFPMSTHGYVYLLPKEVIKPGAAKKRIAHERFARLFGTITGRSGVDYDRTRGVYDHFAYMVVDFNATPPTVDDALVAGAVPGIDLKVSTFVQRMVDTYKFRTPEWPIFK